VLRIAVPEPDPGMDYRVARDGGAPRALGPCVPLAPPVPDSLSTCQDSDPWVRLAGVSVSPALPLIDVSDGLAIPLAVTVAVPIDFPGLTWERVTETSQEEAD